MREYGIDVQRTFEPVTPCLSMKMMRPLVKTIWSRTRRKAFMTLSSGAKIGASSFSTSRASISPAFPLIMSSKPMGALPFQSLRAKAIAGPRLSNGIQALGRRG